MDPDQLTAEEAQKLWDEEAAKLDAGAEEAPASDATAAAPEVPPQEQSSPEAEAPQAEDPLASLPEAVRAKLAQIDQLAQANAQLLHKVNSAEGRVASMQRELQQARVAQQSVAPQDAPSQKQLATAAKNPEKWEQLKQDFPEWAGAMEEYVAAKLGGVQSSAPQVDPKAVEAYVQQQVGATREEMQRAIQEARIEGKYEDWRETVKSAEFSAWFAMQTPDVQALGESAQAKDALKVLDLYHEAKAKPASEIRQERNQRLAMAATTRPGQTPPPRSLDDLSPEELWNHMAAQREKERARRGY